MGSFLAPGVPHGGFMGRKLKISGVVARSQESRQLNALTYYSTIWQSIWLQLLPRLWTSRSPSTWTPSPSPPQPPQPSWPMVETVSERV